MVTPPRVFISYAWEDDEYRDWVERLARRLRDNGVEARLDKWHLEEGDTVARFMNREQRAADRVLVLCSPSYRAKVHATEDGAHSTGSGWEAGLLADQMFADVTTRRKVIAILTRGAWAESAPDFLLGRVYVDLSESASFEERYRDLLRRIVGQLAEAPELGRLPSDLHEPELDALRGEPAEGDPAAAGDADFSLRFTVHESAEGARVELCVGDGEPMTAPFELDLAGSQVGREVDSIAAGECTIDDIQDVGSELWTKLQGGDLGSAVADAKDACLEAEGVLELRLRLPPSLEGLPWEGLYDFDSLESELATSAATAVVREPYSRVPKARDREAEGPLRILVVIPSGSGLGTGTEWEKIQQSVRAAGDLVSLESLQSPVTTDDLAEALRGSWDVVHFIGHGRVDDSGRVELRFNGADGSDDWVPSQQVARMFLRSTVQLAVLNCCHAGAVDVTPLETPGSLGTFLMKARVPAVVVMRYEIADSAAADFSRAFYHELLQGVRPGRVDLAVQEGRATLLRTYVDDRRVRSYVTPILYLAEGRATLFDLAGGSRHAGSADADGEIDPRIDEKLIYALANGRCLPILGAGVLAADAVRSEAIVPDSADLARQLGKASEFPDFERLISAAESSSNWISPMLLERICQHFASTHRDERWGLTEAIKQAYRDFDPPKVVEKIARWPSLGMVYANVDGLLERALVKHRGRNLRVVQTENVGSGANPGDGDLVLLNLRGNYTSPQTMVLTESDEDHVLDRMDEIASFVEDLMNQVGGCTLLFLGVSPRDSLVRALSRRLLRRDVSRNRGTAFFVASVSTRADQAYWEEFAKIEWLELDAETVIEGLSIAAARAEKEAS